MKELERLQEIARILRSPEGCDWDKAQDFLSMRPNLIEEAYEVVEAVDSGEMHHLREELGDLLFTVFFYAQLAREKGEFSIQDVAEDISEKLVRRHPHVFGDVTVEGVNDILANWEAIKQQEKGADGKLKRKSLMDGATRALPALFRANKTQEKASRVGFDWKEAGPVFDKVNEEVAELKEAIEKSTEIGMEQTRNEVEMELGDLLFTITNLARKLDINPELALNRSTDKFQDRFRHMENMVEESNENLKGMSPERLEELWERAKRALSESH